MTVLAAVVLIVPAVYCLVDCLQSELRPLPRTMWVLLILLLPLAGPAAWFAFGRPRRAAKHDNARADRPGAAGGVASGPLGPDDDPEFLDELRRARERQARERPEGD